MEHIRWIENRFPKEDSLNPDYIIGRKEAERACNFHKSFSEYEPTPLVSLENLASRLCIGGIYVKDESKRFGLNAFKVLGASYAIGCYLAHRLNTDISELSFDKLVSDEARERLGDITFYAATDGNHGRGVAWSAARLNQKSVIYMPKGSSPKRLDNIRRAGAKAHITDWNYDDTVRFANETARENGGLIVQDTAWEGYEDIPLHIMQGYSAIAAEIGEQLEAPPTHIFLQAGVGSFAAAIQCYYASVYPSDPPTVVIVEPDTADCFFRSALAHDGKARAVTGDMPTLMAGLACGEPNPIAFDIIKRQSAFFASCPDYVTAYGMRILGNPLKGDPAVVSGESGAVGIGLLACLAGEAELAGFKEKLALNKNSRVLLISTEGDTDPESYRNIVWKGVPSFGDI